MLRASEPSFSTSFSSFLLLFFNLARAPIAISDHHGTCMNLFTHNFDTTLTRRHKMFGDPEVL